MSPSLLQYATLDRNGTLSPNWSTSGRTDLTSPLKNVKGMLDWWIVDAGLVSYVVQLLFACVINLWPRLRYRYLPSILLAEIYNYDVAIIMYAGCVISASILGTQRTEHASRDSRTTRRGKSECSVRTLSVISEPGRRYQSALGPCSSSVPCVR